MKSTKKWLSLLLAVVMVVAVFAGCSKDKNASADIEVASAAELDPAIIGDYSTLKLPLTDKGTTVTIICNSTVKGQNDSVVIKELRRRTGVNVQLDVIPNASFSQKVKVLLASKDEMQDIFAGLSHEEINEYGMQGAFVAIDDYLDKLPNVRKMYFESTDEATINAKINFMAGNGKTYQFPGLNQTTSVSHGFMYRKDIFDKHGIEMWNSPEEFVSVLRQLKKLYPDSTPFISKNKESLFESLLPQFGIIPISGKPMWYDYSAEEWKIAYAQEGFREELEFLKLLYNEGLLDEEFLTLSQPAWTTKMTQADKAFVTFDWLPRMDQFEDQTASTIPEYELRFANYISGTTKPNSAFGGGPGIKNGPNAELALMLEDYLISPSGAQLMTMGIEGVTYKLDENGKAKYIGFENVNSVEMVELEEKYGLYISPLYRNVDMRSRTFDLPERQQEALDKMEGKLMRDNPSVSFWTKEETATVAKYQVPLKTEAFAFATNYVLQNGGDKEWNEWLKKVETLGGSELCKAYNAAQKRTNEKVKK